MNLRDLRYVVAIAEHRNFTRASEAVAVSQPALSNQIKKLEAELGVPIFDRGKDGVSLTHFGHDLLKKAKVVLELVDNIEDMASRSRNKKNQPLRLGVTPTLAAYLSRYFRELFSQDELGRSVVIVEGYPAALAKMVEDRSVDMTFVAKKSFDQIFGDSTGKVDFTSLWLEPVYLAVRSGHPLTQKSSVWAHEVPKDQLIRFDISFGFDLEEDLPSSSEGLTESTGIDVKTARFETVCRHVAQTDTCTIVNAIAAEQFMRDGFGLSFLPFNDEGNMRELGVLTRPQYPHPELVEMLRQRVCETPPSGTIASCSKDMIRLPAKATV